MATHFTCPSCQKTLRVSKKLLGKYLSCPVCAKPFWADPHANTPVKNPPASPAAALNQFWESAIVPSAKSQAGTDSPNKIPELPGNESARSSPANQPAPPPAPPKTRSAKPQTDYHYWNSVRLTAFVLTAAVLFIFGGTALVISLLPKRATDEAAKKPDEVANRAKENQPPPMPDWAVKALQRPPAAQAEDKKETAKVSLSAEELYARASPGVVTITAKINQGKGSRLGSGFFVKDELVHDRDDKVNLDLADDVSRLEKRSVQFAYLLTNYHVIKEAGKVEILLRDQSAGRLHGIVAVDEAADLALLSFFIFSAEYPTRLLLADSTPRVGAPAYAIGSPRGLESSFSAGIVNGFREIKPGVSWLQTTAPISPGSSGGPLLTADGRVIGVTTAGRQDGQNLNFAVPVSEVKRFLRAPYREGELPRSESSQDKEIAWTQEEKENLAHFFLGLSFDKGASRTFRKPVLETANFVLASVWYECALEQAQAVKEDVLAKVHPELPALFKEKYIRALRLSILDLKLVVAKANPYPRPHNESQKEIRQLQSAISKLEADGKGKAIDMWRQWREWWAANATEVRFPDTVPVQPGEDLEELAREWKGVRLPEFVPK